MQLEWCCLLRWSQSLTMCCDLFCTNVCSGVKWRS